jgi:hypothetical protein
MEYYDIINKLIKVLSRETEEGRVNRNQYYFDFDDLTVELESADVVFKMEITTDLDDHIESVNIFSAFFQFTDFECDLSKNLIKKIEKELKNICI